MRTTFESKGETVVADLELPEAGGPFPAAVLLGPLTSVKEQATGNYARALARRGWAALSFDPRYFGESSGAPRQYENPESKIEDARSAAHFLTAHPAIDGSRLVAIGVCAGGGYIAGAVAADPLFKAFGGVAGFYHDATQQRAWMGAGYDAALERATAARERWEQTHVAEFIPAVGREGDVAMPLAEAYAYYGTERGMLGHYQNSFAVMSREKTLPYDAQAKAAQIRVPSVMIHSEKALAPALARSFYERLQTDKVIHWLESQGQIDFYDDPALIEPAVDLLDRELRARLP
jgi:dienelactone hydrolase